MEESFELLNFAVKVWRVALYGCVVGALIVVTVGMVGQEVCRVDRGFVVV